MAESLKPPSQDSNLATVAEQAGLSPVGRRPTVGGYLRTLWQRRSFAITMSLGDLRAQNMDTVLGNLWYLLNPLMQLGVYFLIFGVILQLAERGGITNFLAFLAIGIFLYGYSQKAITQGARSIVSNEGLIRSLTFPRAILPISVVVGQTLSFLPALAVMIGFAVFTGELVTWRWMAVVPIVALLALFNFGAAFVAARVNHLFRDFENLLPFMFRLLFYMSGVLFPVDRFVDPNSPLMIAFTANPLYAAMTLARAAMLHEVSAGWGEIISLVAWSLGLLAAGFALFLAGEKEYGRG